MEARFAIYSIIGRINDIKHLTELSEIDDFFIRSKAKDRINEFKK